MYRWIAIASVLTPIHRGFCIITSLFSLVHTMVGSTVDPSNVFSTCPKLAPIAFYYTRATWMRPAMIRLGDWGLACNLKFIVVNGRYNTLRGSRLSWKVITIVASKPQSSHNFRCPHVQLLSQAPTGYRQSQPCSSSSDRGYSGYRYGITRHSFVDPT